MYALCKRRSNYFAMMFKKILVPKTKCTASTFGTFFGIFDVKNITAPCAPGCQYFMLSSATPTLSKTHKSISAQLF